MLLETVIASYQLNLIHLLASIASISFDAHQYWYCCCILITLSCFVVSYFAFVHVQLQLNVEFRSAHLLLN